MAIVLSNPASGARSGYWSADTLTPATGSQAINLTTDLTKLAASTATQGNFSLAAGIEGQFKTVMMTGTGVLNVVTPSDLGQGYTSVRLTATDQFVRMQYLNGAWHVIASHLVVSGATGVAELAADLYGVVT